MDTDSSEDGYKDQVHPPQEGEVSLLDILLVLARNKILLAWTVFAFTLIGVTYALLASEQYTSEARVVRESQEGSRGALPGGLSSGALSGLGINLGGASSGLTPQAFPDVLESREVRLAVVQDTFRFPDAKRPMTFVEYVNRPSGALGTLLKYTVELPWTLKSALSDAITDSSAPAGTTATDGRRLTLSEEENNALKAIEGMVSSRVDQENGIMTISVTAGGPRLSANLTKSFVGHLTTRVREIRTEKVRERLQFVNKRFKEAEQELERAEDRLAQFLERNQNPTTATLQFRRDRLQRQVSFKEQLYSELQSQLTQTRLDLQRRQPVVTVVEEAVPPMSRSAPRRTAIVVLSGALGILFGCLIAFLRSNVQAARFEGENGEKVKLIKQQLTPSFLKG
ncbi:Wzz/FepE/Etk N-terminal domain-containing protein [Salinibacter ruber]|uniref:Wzz/FepE/Etk N-terminal domain-containing protein n=1 Tax=Salinibacter ruber TaxID=146919 RepID=UPI00207418D0|nr:Wzz/FepE/Etk N-terminal domain-containing protein [Salinibacter ruber]